MKGKEGWKVEGKGREGRGRERKEEFITQCSLAVDATGSRSVRLLLRSSHFRARSTPFSSLALALAHNALLIGHEQPAYTNLTSYQPFSLFLTQESSDSCSPNISDKIGGNVFTWISTRKTYSNKLYFISYILVSRNPYKNTLQQVVGWQKSLALILALKTQNIAQNVG